MEINPAELSSGDRYKLLIGTVVPRPIAFVSTLSPQGTANLAPFSFFNAVGHTPLALMFSISQKRDGGEKDTLRNLRPLSEGGVGEFVVNLAVESYIQQVAEASEPLPYNDSEFDYLSLTAAPSQKISPPRVAESPAAFECRTVQIIAVGTFNVVIGEVVHAFIRDELVDNAYRVDTDQLAAVGRMAGYDYCKTGERFAIPNGFAPDKKSERQT